MIKNMSRLILTLTISLTLIATTVVTPAHGNGTACARKRVNVKLASDSPGRYTVVGWLCGPRTGQRVELLVAGASYDHHYWTTPGYSYVRFAVRTGRTVFAIDRLGTGESSNPPAVDTTIEAHAYVAGQLVMALRTGVVTGRLVRHVTGVGHSVGAAVWMMLFGATTNAAARRERPNDLVLQGFMHDINVPHTVALTAARYPAGDDPKFADAQLPDGYFTTRPGTRSLYYDTRFVAQRVLEHDEATKSTVTSGEIASLIPARDPVHSRAINVPTMIILGANDSLFCNAVLLCATVADLRAREAAHYSGVPTPRWVVLPLSGHDVNAHYDAYLGFAAVQRWINS